MNKTRLYLYDKTQESNGYRGTDLSAYVMQGDELAERLNNELDTAFITLAGYSEKEGFAPTTKMIMDKVTDGVIVATYHWMVDEDLVEKPILSDDTYFDHHISLIEPSVVAQKRPVDNIAVTYKLKDVSLQTLPAFDTEEVVVPSHRGSQYTPTENFSYETRRTASRIIRTLHFGKYFVFDGGISFNNSNKRYAKISADGKTTISISFPKVKIYFGGKDTKNFSYVGDASLDYSINEYNISDQSAPLRTWTGSIITNSAFPSSVTSFAWECYEGTTDQERLCFLPERTDNGSTDVTVGNAKYYAKKYTDTSASTPVYTTSIDALPDKIYTIRLSLHDFGQKPSSYQYSVFSGYPTSEAITTSTTVIGPPAIGLLETSTMRSVEPIQSSMTVSFQTYSESTTSFLYQSSVPYSALDLVAKAVTNSVILPKKSGVCIGDINARDASGKLTSNLPFYVDPNYVNALANTQVIENFYSQKNLWEILVEAGNYIHAVPEIKFGEDDRFMITFSPLGRTDEKTSANRPQSIMNFQGVQDYVSSVSSYITNMVQLGGQVSEWIAPKTTSEQYLVYNDTVSLIVSKPIIELLSIIVKCNSSSYTGIGINDGETADMTQYVFEENVYKVIDIDPAVIPNKGVSLYYSLSDNIIKGCDFRTPTANTGDVQDDYAIKKVIYSAFNGYAASPSTSPWKDIKVNDFTFLVTYRTKDSVRVSQSRPDIRKYLMASRFDPYPINGQFNNQEDTLVDSVKFGLNVYGKLIRTGNTEYTVTEWSPDWNSVRRKGELYRINGDLYYAARIHSVCYSEHIESEVTFSKDFNALSSVIGIPSEPRFYEISEQSAIRREVEINDILYLTTNAGDLSSLAEDTYRRSLKIFSLIFAGEDYAKYVVTAFKGDKDSTGKISNVYGEPTFLKEIITPASAYSCGTTLTYTWDMADNYGAGDKVSASEGTLPGAVNYRSLSAVPYTDIYGKSPLIDFFLISDVGLNYTVEILVGNVDKSSGTLTFSNLTNPLQGEKFEKYQVILLYQTGEKAEIISTNSSATTVKYAFGSGWENLNKGDRAVVTAYSHMEQKNIKALPQSWITEEGETTLRAVVSENPNTTFNNVRINNVADFVSGDAVSLTEGQVLIMNGYYGIVSMKISDTEYRVSFEINSVWGTKSKGDTIFFITAANGNKTDIRAYGADIWASNYPIPEDGEISDINGRGLQLFKDNREAVSFNYNTEMATSSDQFVVSPFVFAAGKTNVKLVLLSEEVNKITSGYINTSSIIAPRGASGAYLAKKFFDLSYIFQASMAEIDIAYTLQPVNENHFNAPESGYAQVKSIAIVYDVETSGAYRGKFVIARNIPSGMGKAQAITKWLLGTPNKSAVFRV